MRKHETFWTVKRLDELRVKSRKWNIDLLAAYFERTRDDIVAAQRFEAQRRKLYVKTVRETINGKSIRVTLFAAEFAEGAKYQPITWASQSML